MAIEPMDTCMYRIASARINSPIAVFLGPIANRVHATFADTFESQRRIRCKDKRIIGVYHSGDYERAGREIKKRLQTTSP